MKRMGQLRGAAGSRGFCGMSGSATNDGSPVDTKGEGCEYYDSWPGCLRAGEAVVSYWPGKHDEENIAVMIVCGHHYQRMMTQKRVVTRFTLR